MSCPGILGATGFTELISRIGTGVTRFTAALDTFLGCLSDYTVDQRGDVGSWVRLAALVALRQYVLQVTSLLPKTGSRNELFSQAMLDEVVSGMLKQAVEKLQSICLWQLRGAAGRLVVCFLGGF